MLPSLSIYDVASMLSRYTKLLTKDLMRKSLGHPQPSDLKHLGLRQPGHSVDDTLGWIFSTVYLDICYVGLLRVVTQIPHMIVGTVSVVMAYNESLRARANEMSSNEVLNKSGTESAILTQNNVDIAVGVSLRL